MLVHHHYAVSEIILEAPSSALDQGIAIGFSLSVSFFFRTMTSSSYDAIIEVVLTNCYVSTDSIKGALLALSRSCHLTELVSFFCTTLQSSGCGRTTSKLSKIDHHQFAIDASKSKVCAGGNIVPVQYTRYDGMPCENSNM